MCLSHTVSHAIAALCSPWTLICPLRYMRLAEVMWWCTFPCQHCVLTWMMSGPLYEISWGDMIVYFPLPTLCTHLNDVRPTVWDQLRGCDCVLSLANTVYSPEWCLAHCMRSAEGMWWCPFPCQPHTDPHCLTHRPAPDPQRWGKDCAPSL
jgi:hypothetical protein